MIIRKSLVILASALLLMCIPLAGQVPADLASLERKSEINEQFEGNTTLWLTDNQYLTGRIEDGYYNLKCKNYKGQTGLSYIPLEISSEEDYEIETTIRINSGTGGLVFGMDDRHYHYRVELGDNGDLFIARNTDKIEKLYEGLKNKGVKTGEFNKIVVSKMGIKYFVFVNNTLVKELDNIKPFGAKAGFNVGIKSEITIDNIRISTLEKKPVVSAAVAEASISNQVLAPSNSKLPGTDDPVVMWISPSAEKISQETYSARVKASVRSNSPLISVKFYINGTSSGEGERIPDANNPGSFIIEKSLTLPPGENTVYFLATNEKGGSKRSDNRYFHNPEAAKPVISWNNPMKTNVSVTSELLTIDACINSPTGLKSVKILVNGESQGVDNIFNVSTESGCNVRWQKSIILREGVDNSLYIIAENAAGDVTSENRIIRYSKAIAEKRIALVIGNSNYGSRPPLKNPVNDANLIEGTLKGLGFEVIKKLNLDLDSMELAIRDFSRKINDYNVALFYYAGHGIQVDGENYLIPTDAKLEKKEDCKWETFAVNDLLEEFNRQPDKVNIAIFDACRSNPFTSWVRGDEAGFVPLTNTTGTFVSFATAPGMAAADGETGNGLFTEELVKQMDIIQPIESVFTNTRIRVYDRSKKAQRPQVWNDLNGEFYFKKQ